MYNFIILVFLQNILYKINTILKILPFMVLTFKGFGQQKKFQLTPETKGNLVSSTITIPSKFKDKVTIPAGVRIPEGYTATIFYAGNLAKPRFMCWSPDSVLHVINMNSGEVLALPDRNHDHVADTVFVAANNTYGHDVKFYGNDMFVAEEKKVLKFSDNDHDGIFETRKIFIDSILPGKKRPPGGHTSRTIVFDGIRKKIYLSVGSLCNICREDDRAVIYEYDMNGKNKRIYASGTRNCVGMAINPFTGKLWATNNGSDNQGEDIPPEWIDKIEEGGFYGYPFAYSNQIYFNFKADSDYQKILPITKADSLLVKKMKPNEVLVQAHSAPMAIQFSNSFFKAPFKKGAFVAYRGSWDRKQPTGYKVVFLTLNNKNKVSSVTDIITGFLPEDGNKPWARPVGLQTDLRGNLYMSSDDENQFILILSPIIDKGN